MPTSPELDEYVIATVRKIMPYGAFCSLDEYNGMEVFLHVSEVSSGWIRNIREYVKEGQRIVGKVIRLDAQKNQVDISLKRVTEADRKRKLQAATQENRASKLLEHCAKKLKVPVTQAYAEAGNALAAEFGDLYSAFEAIANGHAPASKIPAQWLEVVTEVARQEIKPKIAEQRYSLTIQTYDGNGIDLVKRLLGLAEETARADGVQVTLHYVGAPHYYIDAVAKDYKSLEKTFAKVEAALVANIKGDTEYSLEKLKK